MNYHKQFCDSSDGKRLVKLATIKLGNDKKYRQFKFSQIWHEQTYTSNFINMIENCVVYLWKGRNIRSVLDLTSTLSDVYVVFLFEVKAKMSWVFFFFGVTTSFQLNRKNSVEMLWNSTFIYNWRSKNIEIVTILQWFCSIVWTKFILPLHI
jgi:hypothetical protein